ncbi:MAG: P1 family peptidase, partial [Planctomycetes bacterium]|nr:P1 family peptidase [Planctomycetota bacterium]
IRTYDSYFRDEHAWAMPIVAETYDGTLNDINALHVKPEHAIAALDAASTGPVAEGSVGGGNGMIAYEFKGGTGTASRRVEIGGKTYTIGALVQANYGRRPWFTVLGVPVGREMPEGTIRDRDRETGSIIVILATDAPLLPHQCKRLARRVTLGLARSGTVSHNGSGDLFLAFSTANAAALDPDTPPSPADFLANDRLDPLFAAVVQATDEAVVDSMVANRAMTGRDGITVQALPHDRVRALLARHGILRDIG